jgi:hypothetical protein
MTYSTVEGFKNAWLKAGCPIAPPFKNAVYTTDIAYSLVLYRKGQYQVELYTCKPSTQAPLHQHPNVDSLFIYLAGNIDFGMADGSFTDLAKYQHETPEGNHMLLGKTAAALNGAAHTLRVYEEGGAFLSFEKWLNDDPTSVTVHWTGEPVGADHAETLQAK